MMHARDKKSTGCSKHECRKGKNNGYMPKKNEREMESQQNQDDMTTLSGIKAWKGLMEHHIKHAN
jgi:hypothetical protein